MSDPSDNPILTTSNRQTPVPSAAEGIPVVPGNGGYFPYGRLPMGDENDFRSVAMRYVRLLFKYKWIIASIVLATGTFGFVSTMLKTPIYSAVTRIQIDPKAMQVVDGGAQQQSDTIGIDDLRTQYELLKSRNLAERVTSQLQLSNDEAFFAPRNKSFIRFLMDFIRPSSGSGPQSPAARQAWAVSIVGTNIAIRPVPQSRLADLIYSDPSPDRAQRIVNAYADAFIAANLDKRFEANAYARTFLDDQIAQMEIRLDDSEQALIDYSEKEKVIDVNKTSITEDNLTAANTTLGGIVAERMKNEQSWQQMQNTSVLSLPQFLNNPVIDGLRARRNALQTEYKEKSASFRPGYPAMVQISNQIAEIDRQIASEIETIRSAAKASYEASVVQEQDMQNRLEKLRSEVIESQKKGVRYKMLKDEVDTNHSLYNSLLQRSKELDVASGVGTNNVFVVDRALLPGAPTEPNFSRSMLKFLAMGLAGGLGAAFLLDKLNDRIHRPEEAEELSGLRALGIIPTVRDGVDFRAYLHDPNSAVSEAYRSLATALQFSTSLGMPRSIVITSAAPSEGKSSTCFAIARHFAATGMRVLLVDADMRKPSLHQFLNRDNLRGLSSYLVGTAEPPEVIVQTEYPRLAFLPSGPIPPNAADILVGTRMHSLVSIGAEVFDLIVIDAPPMLALADAQLLAGTAAATLFVIAAGKPRKGLIRSALRRLQLTHHNMMGIVLTNFDTRSTGYGYYGHDYSYNYRYGAENENQPKITGAKSPPAEKLKQG